ncbi:MAG: enoyl-CoA hydratase [Burkholderiales bacterium]|nr:enoyl-CoA hydratase [Burkholderiales bacterium]
MNAPVSAEALARPLVLRSDADGVATLTLNRGDRLNPLSSEMIAAVRTELAAIATDTSVRAVVIAGAGRGFCAGHDMKEIHAHPDPAWQQKLFDDCAAMMQAIVGLPQPVIARVHGVAAAAGCQLVSMCDLAVAVPEAKFALSGIHNGLFCSTPAVGVVRNVNRKRAMEMLVTGDLIDAQTALAWGLVNRVVPAEALDAEVAKFTDAIKAKSGAAIALGKQAFYKQADLSLSDAYDLAGRTMTCNLQDPDGREGVDAFVNKRKAVWRDG